jgi:hypothetical protein
MNRKSTREKSYDLRGYRSTVVSFVVITFLAVLLIFSLVIFPGLVSSWRSNRLNGKGISECTKGELYKGKEAFRKAVALNPDNATAHYNLALVLLSSDDDAANAADHLREVIRLEPDCALAYHNLGVTELFYQRKTGLALENLRKAEALDPDYAPTHFALGYLYEYAGEYGKAVEEFSLYVSGNPSGPLRAEAEASVKALEGAPLVDDLAEKLSYEEKVYEIIVAGEVCIDEPLETDDSARSPLRFVAPAFGKALFSVASLSVVAAEEKSDVSPEEIKSTSVGHERINLLTDAGLDAIAILPDRTPGLGLKALNDTVGYLESEAIVCTGAGPDVAAAVRPARIEAEEITVEVLAFNGVSATSGDEETGEVYYAPLSTGVALPAITDAASDADIVVVVVRWAGPSQGTPANKIVLTARAMVDAGADIVVGIGAGEILPVESYRRSVIAYGLPRLLPRSDLKPFVYTSLVAVQYSPDSGVIGYRLVPVYVENSRPSFSGDTSANLIDFRLVDKVPMKGSGTEGVREEP